MTLQLGRSEASAMLGLAPQSDNTRPHSMGPGWDRIKHSVESGIMHGFQLATAAGPLCDEPMWGIAFEVEARLNVPEGEDNPGNVNLAEEVYGPFSGQVGFATRFQHYTIALQFAGNAFLSSDIIILTKLVMI